MTTAQTYRCPEPIFCRSCGKRWQAGASHCPKCAEPATAPNLKSAAIPYRSQATRVTWINRWTWVHVAMLVAFPAAFVVVVVVWRNSGPEEWINTVCGLAIVFELTWYAVGVALRSSWLYEAGRNARTLRCVSSQFREESAVIWTFVPLANLIAPLKGWRTLWTSARGPLESSAAQYSFPTRQLGVWWTFEILSSLARWFGLAWLHFGEKSDVAGSLLAASGLFSWLSLYLLRPIADILGLRIVKKVEAKLAFAQVQRDSTSVDTATS